VHGLRIEYQDRVNFVILDFDIAGEVDLARGMSIAQHPAYGVIPPDGSPDEIAERIFGPRNQNALREVLERVIARYPAGRIEN